jgi:hypothetical protein
MDTTTLAQTVTVVLSPCLPYLLKLGDKAAEEAAKKVGGEVWEVAKKLWHKLSPVIATNVAATEAVEDVASAPDDADTVAALRRQLVKLFSGQPDIAAEVSKLIESAGPATRSVIASGHGAVAVGGNMTGSTVVTHGGTRQKH